MFHALRWSKLPQPLVCQHGAVIVKVYHNCIMFDLADITIQYNTTSYLVLDFLFIIETVTLQRRAGTLIGIVFIIFGRKH